MTVIEHPAHRLASAQPENLGEPGSDDRWEPTRAGIVNSWAWAEETLLFADGWLALTGPNGSGKSLTASMLITVLLDGDVSQTAMSVSGKAAGTLTSRHTDRNEDEDRTGIWWLEYGWRDREASSVRYLTTGLWLRNHGEDLQRAFFVTPGRVGIDLILQREREPVRIEDLAAQLASCDGEMYTSSSRLIPKAQSCLRAVRDEADYRHCIRRQLFAPLDEVQFEALIGVLRSLRSVRTAENISAKQMRAVLTDALPALDPDRLTIIAESMERIADLERQLRDIQAETALLEGVDKVYRRYLDAVLLEGAAALADANREFEDQSRQVRDASARLSDAEALQASIEEEQVAARKDISGLEGRLEAANAALRDHAGAELPVREQRARELAQDAIKAAERAASEKDEAAAAADEAATSSDTAYLSQHGLRELTQQLQTDAAVLGAAGAAEQLLGALQRLGAATQAEIIEGWDHNLRSTPAAWADVREARTHTVQDSLRGYAQAQQSQKSAAQDRRAAEDAEDSSRTAAENGTSERQEAEETLLEELVRWAAECRHLGPVPSELTAHDSESDIDRLDPERLDVWLEEAAVAARTRIALPRYERAEAAATAVAMSAAGVSRGASQEQERTRCLAEEAATGHDEAAETARRETEAAERQEMRARAGHQESVIAAQHIVSTAQEELDTGIAEARQAAQDWIRHANAWRATIIQIPASAVVLPASDADVNTLDALAPERLRLAIADLHASTASELEHKVAEAIQGVREADSEARAKANALATARQAAPLPPAPSWRTRTESDGTPLWALVDFAEQLAPADANRIEGALLVSGLLDALVTSDGRVVAGDLVISPGDPHPGLTLADLLEVEADPTVNADQVLRVLRAIPVDGYNTDIKAGKLANGVLTASAPRGYEAAFIGRTARERSRLAHVHALEQELAIAEALLADAEQVLAVCKSDVLAAKAERDAFPRSDELTAARDHVSRLRTGLLTARNTAAEQTAQAELLLERLLAELEQAAGLRAAAVAAAKQAADHASQIAADAATRADEARAEASRCQEAAARAESDREQAESAQRSADQERAAFPHQELLRVRRAQASEDRLTDELNRCRSDVIRVSEQHRQASEAVSEALSKVNADAELPDGSSLPTEQRALDEHRDYVVKFAHHVEIVHQAAQRCAELLRSSSREAATAARRAAAASAAAKQADDADMAAVRETAAVQELRMQYGAEYEQLSSNRLTIETALGAVAAKAEQLLLDQLESAKIASSAKATLDGIAPQRERAENNRNQCLERLNRLTAEHLAVLPDDIPADALGCPAHINAALTWSRRILAGKHAGPDRLGLLAQARGRALSTLENSARTASASLARYDRQVTLYTVEGTDWRRAVVADPEAARGEDVHAAIQSLRDAARELDADLREDVKRTLKTGLFTQLRRDVQVRREAAQQLVRQIRTTLGKVRTGVAHVGMEVDWSVREDEDAQRMVDLISQPPSDEVFEQMYAVLRQRMDEVAGEEWKERVAHAFDYRAWHEWRIRVTHASFGAADGKERFREVTARSNPLESLSTGERRLATMLPLLAAAWSMYSGHDYHGPRILSIDEIDAAFDESNLRRVLALLRSWDFDVLATAPSMAPMIKRETRRVAIHEVIKAGQHRVTVPWLWEGHGEPTPLTLELGFDVP